MILFAIIYSTFTVKGENLHNLKSDNLRRDDGESIVDDEHFTDLGFYRFAERTYPVVWKLMKRAGKLYV